MPGREKNERKRKEKLINLGLLFHLICLRGGSLCRLFIVAIIVVVIANSKQQCNFVLKAVTIMINMFSLQLSTTATIGAVFVNNKNHQYC